jgi:hypothetical protein
MAVKDFLVEMAELEAAARMLLGEIQPIYR